MEKKPSLNLSGNVNQDALSPLKSPLLRRHLAPLQANIHYPESLYSSNSLKKNLFCDDGFFRVSLDVHDFKDEEIKLKTVGHTIIIELSHDERPDEHSVISRKIIKKYVLPTICEIEKIKSWTSQRVLHVQVPSSMNSKTERIIGIKFIEASAIH